MFLTVKLSKSVVFLLKFEKLYDWVNIFSSINFGKKWRCWGFSREIKFVSGGGARSVRCWANSSRVPRSMRYKYLVSTAERQKRGINALYYPLSIAHARNLSSLESASGVWGGFGVFRIREIEGAASYALLMQKCYFWTNRHKKVWKNSSHAWKKLKSLNSRLD